MNCRWRCRRLTTSSLLSPAGALPTCPAGESPARRHGALLPFNVEVVGHGDVPLHVVCSLHPMNGSCVRLLTHKNVCREHNRHRGRSGCVDGGYVVVALHVGYCENPRQTICVSFWTRMTVCLPQPLHVGRSGHVAGVNGVAHPGNCAHARKVSFVSECVLIWTGFLQPRHTIGSSGPLAVDPDIGGGIGTVPGPIATPGSCGPTN